MAYFLSGAPIATTRLWSELEAGVFDTVATELERQPDLLWSEKLSNLKGPLVTFSRMDAPHQVRYLLQRFEENQGSGPGVERFERLTKLIGLIGPVDPQVTRQLLWCSAVRNLLVHNRGTVDVIYVKQCPWRKERVGERLRLEDVTFRMCSAAVQAYLVTLALRCDELGEADPEGLVKTRGILNRYLENLHRLVAAAEAPDRPEAP